MSGQSARRVRKAAPDRTVSEPVIRLGAEPPNSAEVECRILGWLLQDETPSAWGVAQNCGLKHTAFYGPARSVIWQTIEDMKARGAVVSLHTVGEELRLLGSLNDVGGWSALTEMVRGVTTSLDFRHNCDQLRLLWEMRRTQDLAGRLNQAVVCFESREQFAEAIGDVGQRLIRFGRREATRTLEEQIEAVKDDVAKRVHGQEDRSRWVYTGLPTFDLRLRPLNSARLDGLTVVAGGSGEGKSALLRQLTWNALEAGGSCVVYTRETDIESLIEQMVAAACMVNLEELPEYKLWPDRLARFAAECDRLMKDVANKRLWVIQHEPATPLEKVEQLAQHYRAHAHLHGHPSLVVVDYLQLFGTEKRTASREQEVSTVSHAFQALQRESGNAWAIGAQLNESGINDMRTIKRDDQGRLIHRLPRAGDLRESQAIYHDADRVIVLYRPPEDCRGQDNLGPNVLKPEIWICQIKRRKGACGVVKCWLEKIFTRFVELGSNDHGPAGGGSPASPAPARPPVPPPATKGDILRRSQGGPR